MVTDECWKLVVTVCIHYRKTECLLEATWNTISFFYTQKQPPEVFYRNIKKETLAEVFYCEFCEIFKNTFFTEHLWTTASLHWFWFQDFSVKNVVFTIISWIFAFLQKTIIDFPWILFVAQDLFVRCPRVLKLILKY